MEETTGSISTVFGGKDTVTQFIDLVRRAALPAHMQALEDEMSQLKRTDIPDAHCPAKITSTHRHGDTSWYRITRAPSPASTEP